MENYLLKAKVKLFSLRDLQKLQKHMYCTWYHLTIELQVEQNIFLFCIILSTKGLRERFLHPRNKYYHLQSNK